MKKSQRFVKVVGTLISSIAPGGRLVTTIGKGILPLGPRITEQEFIQHFLQERGLDDVRLYYREPVWATQPAVFLTVHPKIIVSYVFFVFGADAMGYQLKDLTQEERDRDMKALGKTIKD